MTHSHKSKRPYDVLDGLGEAMLNLARKHSTTQQWASWLKVPLQGAAAEGDLTMVSTLLKAGAACSGERERDGQTPLHAAAQSGSLEVVLALLQGQGNGNGNGKAQRDVNKPTRGLRQTPLFVAAKRGHADVALALVRAGADVDLPDGNGWSPLMRAAADGRAELVNNLLLGGASPSLKSKKGGRALHFAVQNGHLEVARVLLKAGASPGARRKMDGKSAVDLAVERGGKACEAELLRELLAAAGGPGGGGGGGGVDGLDDGGLSALSVAARGGHAWAIEALVDAGADPDEPNDDQDTPLHLACLHLQPEGVRALLRRGADETLCNDDFDLPDDVVGHCVPEENRDEEIVEWIHEMLARAQADRVWRRRGWLAMLSARRRRSLVEVQWTKQNHRNITHLVASFTIQQEQVRQQHQAIEQKQKQLEHHESDAATIELVDTSRSAEDRRLPCDWEPWSARTASRRRFGGQGEPGAGLEGVTSEGEGVHPSLKKFHWTVGKMVDVADELIFRRIVTYL